MRFRQLSLLRFGPFTDGCLDFGSADRDLHLIYGPNEAGKSSALRAVSGFLFGIPERTVDAHLHLANELRIGAVVESRAGDSFQAVRRKGRKDTLLDESGKPVRRNLLEEWSGGMSREVFELTSGLSLDRLAQGGRDLLEGKGELGESLFSAGLGLAGFHALRRDLAREADEIYTPRGHTKSLNRAIKNYHEAKGRVREQSLRPAQWQDAERQLGEVRKERSRLDEELIRLRKEQAQLERLGRTSGPLVERRGVLQQLQEIGEPPPYPPSGPEDRRSAQLRIDQAGLRVAQLSEERRLLVEERKGQEVPTGVLERAADIDELVERRGAHRKAMRDLPTLRAEAAAIEREVVSLAESAGEGTSGSALRIPSAAQRRIKELGRRKGELEAALRDADESLNTNARVVEQLEREIETLPGITDLSALRQALDEVQRRGDIAKEIRKIRKEMSLLEDQARTRLAALGLWAGPLEEVVAIPLPVEATVDRFRRETDEVEKARVEQRREQERLLKEIEALAGRLDRMSASGAVPTEDDLRSAREVREGTWSHARASLTSGVPLPDSSPVVFADRYEREVLAADTAADRLRLDAQRAGEFAVIRDQQRDAQEQLDAIRKALSTIDERYTAIAAGWLAVWEPAGVAPLGPAEMREWLVRHRELCDTVRLLQEHRANLAAVESESDELCGSLVAALPSLAPPPGELLPLAGLRDRAIRLIADADTETQHRRELNRSLHDAKTRQDNSAAKRETAAQMLALWRSEWSEAASALGLGPGATIEETDQLLEARAKLVAKRENLDDRRARIKAIEQDMLNFEAEAAAVASAAGVEPGGRQGQDIVSDLQRRLEEAKTNRDARQNTDRRIEKILDEIREHEFDRDGAQKILDNLVTSTGSQSVQDLGGVERRVAHHRDLTGERSRLERQLLAEGLPLEELEREAEGSDPDTLAGRLEGCSLAFEQTTEALRVVGPRIGELENAHRAMVGQDTAAVATFEVQEALAAIRRHTAEYARLRTASHLLEREMARYRREQQDPVLARTGELFRRLTLGAFTGINTGFDEDDNGVVLCVRRTGQEVRVDGLSEGTRDQLYLALRLASVERQAAASEPLPFILDDVLVKFDDARTRAAIEVLMEVAAATQVVLFTHHSRLVELAGEVNAAGRLALHELGVS